VLDGFSTRLFYLRLYTVFQRLFAYTAR